MNLERNKGHTFHKEIPISLAPIFRIRFDPIWKLADLFNFCSINEIIFFEIICAPIRSSTSIKWWNGNGKCGNQLNWIGKFVGQRESRRGKFSAKIRGGKLTDIRVFVPAFHEFVLTIRLLSGYFGYISFSQPREFHLRMKIRTLVFTRETIILNYWLGNENNK